MSIARSGRMNVRIWLGLIIVASTHTAARATDAGGITTESLLREMTDLKSLAEFPDPPFTCKQASSYDRASKSPGNKSWFANGDCGQFIRIEERDGHPEFVMMDEDGPGAIVRIWSANPMGTMRIHLDGVPNPVIELPFKDYLGGKMPHVPDPIACERS